MMVIIKRRFMQLSAFLVAIAVMLAVVAVNPVISYASTTKVLDVSCYQGKNIDWSEVKASGYNYAVVRALYGNKVSQKDSCLETNYANATAAGVKILPYHYSHAYTAEDAVSEANAFLQVVSGKTFASKTVFLDIETSKHTKMSSSALQTVIDAYASVLEAEGWHVVVYSYLVLLKKIGVEWLDQNYSVWVAQLSSSCSYTGNKVMWQYTYSESVNGISGLVDCSYLYDASVFGDSVSVSSTSSTSSSSSDSSDTFYYNFKTGKTTASLNVRSAPSTSASIITTLSKGAEVSITGENGDFYIISNGYISKKYVTIESSDSAAVSDTLYGSSKSGKTTSAVNLRSKPSTSSSIIKVIEKGSSVTILGENGNFYKTSDGYLAKAYVTFSSDTLYSSYKKGTVTADKLNLRSKPSTSASIIKTYSQNDTVTLIGENGDFYKTPLGYVSKTYVKIGTSTKSSQNSSKETLYNSKKYGKTTTEVNLRAKASTSSSIVKVLPANYSLTIIGESGNFYKTAGGNYIYKNYLTFTSASSSTTTKASESKKYGITTTAVNLRSGASTSSKIVKCLSTGTALVITGEDGSFYKTENGYVAKKYVKIYKDTLYSTALTGTLTDTLNVRVGPSTSYSVVKQLTAGKTVTILGVNNGFYKISSGYISKDYVTIKNNG